ncbi:MAG: hypothetical protein JNM70_10115 [Anaerolineae bacterium]|nr:hypothetical protein [Anaerolineae bacterium]
MDALPGQSRMQGFDQADEPGEVIVTLPALTNWDSTRQGLHRAAQVAAAIRKPMQPPLPNFAHLGLSVTRDGLESGRLPNGANVALNFRAGRLVFQAGPSGGWELPLAGYSQRTLAEAAQQALAESGSPIQIDLNSVPDTNPLDIDAGLASDYAGAVFSIYTAIARVRARFLGAMSPMIVFPHGFDLSSLWFARGSEERSDPHLNIGFSPGSAGLPRPYVYLYTHPIPPGWFDIRLPEAARWWREGWQGVILDYDALAAVEDHEALLEHTLREVAEQSAALLAAV